MDSLETPYEEDVRFIQCTVCDKSIMGESLYKVHLTTPAHLKKEDSLVALGQAVRHQVVPKFTDLEHYLDFLQLNEPIIGLDCVEEIPNTDPQFGPKYVCKICKLPGGLIETACHVIGRKHRQKYVEARRPDLMTWDHKALNTQGGKIMRAKAEIIERQDGRGHLQRLPRWENEMSDFSRNQRHNRGPGYQQEPGPNRPGTRNWDHPNAPAPYPDELHGNNGRPFHVDNSQEEFHKATGHQRNRDGFANRDYRGPNDEQYSGNLQRQGFGKPSNFPDYSGREEQGYQPETGASSYQTSYPETDPLEEFYAEEMRRGRASQEQPNLQSRFSNNNNRRWSLERESGGHSSLDRSGRQGSGGPDAKRRNVTQLPESEGTRDHLFDVIKDYHNEMRSSHQQKPFENLGLKRDASPAVQRNTKMSTNISNIPEPFRRFLEGGLPNQQQTKRRSRFSDATPEELEKTKAMLHGAPGSLHSAPLGEDRSQRPQSSVTQGPRAYGEPQAQGFSGNYHTGPASEGVFDILKNIEIETPEEAEFLKSRLSSLLKEFQDKKMERKAAGQSDFEKTSRESFGLDQRRSNEANGTGRREWNQHQQTTDEQYQSYQPSVNEEPRRQMRGRYEDQSTSFPGRFQEPACLPNYQHKPEISDMSAPSPFMDQENRRQRDPTYSRSLDKITSALLELVARK